MIGLNLAGLSYSKCSNYNKTQNISFKGKRRSSEAVLKALGKCVIQKEIQVGIDQSVVPPKPHLFIRVQSALTPEQKQKAVKRVVGVFRALHKKIEAGDIASIPVNSEGKTSFTFVTTKLTKDGSNKGVTVYSDGTLCKFSDYGPDASSV